MSSAERIDGGELDTAWTYDTPYDVVHRRRTIRKFGASSMRALHMDAYIDYMNNAMSPMYAISTYIDTDKRHVKNGTVTRNPGTQIYRPDARGKYKRYAHIVVDGEETMFFGDKIIRDGQDVVVVNTEAELGISPTRTIRMVPIENNHSYFQKVTHQKNHFGLLLETMMAIEKGDRYHEWDEFVLA